VLAAVPSAESWWRTRTTQRCALLVLALVQLAIAAPMLILGHDHDAGVHAAHELGSFNLALAIAFVVGAVRPSLSAGLAWPCGVAAIGLAVTAVTDLFSGQTIGADEAQHLIAVAGAAVLVWQARTMGEKTAAPAAAVDAAHEDPRPVARALQQAVIPPEPPGGSAARLTAPADAAEMTNRSANAALPACGGDGRDESVA